MAVKKTRRDLPSEKSVIKKTWDGYRQLEFSGSFLIPGFSVYVLEIEKSGQKHFYIGMTGDPFYPSARAAFHRLSGHLEKGAKSKQNQLWIALQTRLNIQSEADLMTLNIRMHHFPIEGFKKWVLTDLHHKNIKANQSRKEYRVYKEMQQEVFALEQALIANFKNNALLNQTEHGDWKVKAKYQGILNQMKRVIK